MRATSSYIENIAFSTEDGEGIIYKNWTNNTVAGFTNKIYKSVFHADTYKFDDVSVQMDGKNVVIKHAHTHKLCGIATNSVCEHADKSTHGNMQYDESLAADTEFPTGGSAFLTESLTNVGEISLEADLYLCLNGHDLSGVNFVSNGKYRVYITNCIEENNEITSDATKYLADDAGLIILSGLKPITVNADKLIKHDEDDFENGVLNLLNVQLKSISNAVIDSDVVNITSNTAKDNKLNIASVSIAGFRTADNVNFINVSNVVATVSTATFKSNEVGTMLSVGNDAVVNIKDLDVENNKLANVINITGSNVQLDISDVDITSNEISDGMIRNANDNIININNLDVEENNITGDMFDISGSGELNITNSVIAEDNIVSNDMFSVDGKLTISTISIIENDITGSMFNVTGDSINFSGFVNIFNNEVGADLINSEVDMDIKDTFIVDDNEVEENLIYTTKVINVDGKVDITENIVNNGHLLYTEDNININNTKFEKFDVVNNTTGGYLVYAKDIISNSEINIVGNKSDDTLIEVENLTVDNYLSIEQNRTFGTILDVEEDLSVEKDMLVSTNIASASVIHVGNNLSMPTSKLQITDNDYAIDADNSLIHVEGDVFEVKQIDISQNETIKGTKVIALDNAELLSTGGDITVNNNTLARAENGVQNIITLNNGQGIVLKNGANLEVKDNVVTADHNTNNNILSVINLSSSQVIEVATGSIVVKDNTVTGTKATDKLNHIYGIYSSNVDEIITQTANTKIDGANTYVDSIAFNNPDNTGSGIIYVDWTEENVSGWTKTLYRDVFVADTTKHTVTVKMDGDNVVIAPPHVHKICGVSTTSECDHEGIDAHTKYNVGIATYSELLNGEDFPTKGAYYLQENYNGISGLSVKEVVLTGDLYLCLNGLTLSNVIFKQTNYNIYITNCKDKEASIKLPANNKLFENIKAHIITSKGSINVVSDNIFTTSRATDEYTFYNVNMRPVDENASSQVSMMKTNITGNSSLNVNILKTTIASYSTIESLIDLPNANLNMNEVSIKQIDTKKHLINIVQSADNNSVVKLNNVDIKNIYVENSLVVSDKLNSIEIIDSKFENIETHEGDMIVLKSKNNTIEKTIIKNNKVTAGSLITKGDSKLIIDDTTIEENTVDRGIIVSDNTTASEEDVIFKHNANIINNKISQNTTVPMIRVSNANLVVEGRAVVDKNTANNVTFELIDVKKNLIINDNAVLDITENTIVRSNSERQILVKADNYIIKLNAKLNVTNNTINCLSTAIGNKKILAAIYISSKPINVSTSSIVVSSNNSTGATATLKSNHFYGVYSENKDGFIVQTDGQIRATASHIENIAFSTDDGEGIIYKNWTNNTVAGFTAQIYKTVFSADINVHDDLSVQMDGKNVVIKKAHIHKLCGIASTSECTHTGIPAHTDMITFEESLTKDSTFPTEGGAFLTESMNNVGLITLTDDLDICLNGFDINGIRFNANGHKLNITNCQNKQVVLTNDNSDEYIFSAGNINVMTGIGSMKVVTDGMYKDVNTTEVVNANFYNVVIENITDNSSMSLINAKETTDRDSRVVLSSTSIAKLTYQTNVIETENVDLEVYDSIIDDIHIASATGDIINAKSIVELYNVEITNNIVDDGDIIEVIGNTNIASISNANFLNNQSTKLIISDNDIIVNKVAIINNETFSDLITAKVDMEVNGEFVVKDNKTEGKLITVLDKGIFNDKTVIENNKSYEELLEVANIETKEKLTIKSNIATNSIITSKTIDMKGETVIEDNIFGSDNGSSVISVTEDTLNIATLSIINNTSKVAGQVIASANAKIVSTGDITLKQNEVTRVGDGPQSFITSKGIELVGNANLIVEDNKFDVTLIPIDSYPFGALIIYLDRNDVIKVGKGYVRVTGNIATGSVTYDDKNHLSQIYAINNTTDTNPIFKNTTGQKVDGANFYVEDIIFSAANGSGIVFENWTRDTVNGWTQTLFEEVFTADTILHGAAKVLMNGDDVIIGNNHIHKACGIATTSECKHDGVPSHSDEITYEEVNINKPFPTEGAYYIPKDIENVGEVVLTDDLYLCLNGRTVKGIKFSGNYNVIITNCAKKDIEIISNAGDTVFNNNKTAQILAGVGSIKVLTDALVDGANVEKILLHNAILEPVDDEEPTNKVVINVANTNAEFVISSVSITEYKSGQNIINSVADINVYGLNAVYNQSNERFINTTKDIIFYRDSMVDDGITVKDTVKANSIKVVDSEVKLTANIVVAAEYSIVNVNSDITLSSPSTLHMQDNLINRSSDKVDTLIAISSANGYIELGADSKLEIIENEVDTKDITTNTKAAAALYLTSNQKLKVSTSSIVIKDNAAYRCKSKP